MKLFLKKFIFALIFLSVFTIGWGYFCDRFFANPKFFDDVTNKRAWTIKQHHQNFDFAVLGSSRAYGAFDMPQLNALRNKTGINLGANGSGYVDNYLILYLFLKNHNKIKTLFLQVDIYSLSSKSSFSNAFHTHQFLPFWQDTIVSESLSPFIDKKERLAWTVVPSIRYFKFNKYFSPKEVIRRYRLRRPHLSPFDKTFGGPPDGSEGAGEQHDNSSSRQNLKRTFDQFDVSYLIKIIAFCKENNIRVIAYRAPELLSRQNSITNYNDLDLQIESILKNQGTPYVRPDPTIETDINNFTNPTHLNAAGREVFTRSFSEQASKIDG